MAFFVQRDDLSVNDGALNIGKNFLADHQRDMDA
jgi:hypothetical protein